MCVVIALPLLVLAQSPRRVIRPMGPNMQAGTAESAVKQAMDQLVAEKKAYERDLEVLQRLRNADVALTDPMQPNNAIQKALDEVEVAKGLAGDLTVKLGVIKIAQELEAARRSPLSADFGRLRGILRSEAAGPAVRLVARNGAKLAEDSLAWIKVQELISSHLRSLAEISAESLRATQQ